MLFALQYTRLYRTIYTNIKNILDHYKPDCHVGLQNAGRRGNDREGLNCQCDAEELGVRAKHFFIYAVNFSKILWLNASPLQ